MRSISDSLKLYIFVIGNLQKQKACIQQIDIAIELGYSRPSVHHAITRLRQEKLLEDTRISLSEAGSCVYRSLQSHYEVLCSLLRTKGMKDQLVHAYALRLLMVVDDCLLAYLTDSKYA